LELKLLAAYTLARKLADPKFDLGSFAAAYATLGAQRATKILGIFARLDRRDRKPQYLAHLPRLKKYLVRNLAHPALRDLKLWYETNLQSLFGAAR
ncbi:MAG: bifunctional tRNA (adenosine(37)-N6)-threonylcarbamoyltransferase complex ATPase subunit type 1 TsaE/phosphotransferase, partial [Hyphomicrobiales bacterium]|nr:bifunctional tRNA (adenosine(37)-N6)-threonylcarbamoyltransferase complex ATPase subunit type 1 TsaE/phosphotransferase [Hyphomicrobiales bacterium]